LKSSDVPAEVKAKYSEAFVNDFCFAGNRDTRKQQSSCPPMSQCSAGE